MSPAEPAAGTTMAERRRPLVTIAAGIATPLVLVALAIVPFLTPLWMFPAQARAEADAWTGWPIETVHAVTGEVLVDLIVGPPDFDQEVDGVPVFNEREVQHLRDVRTLFIGLAVLAAVAAAVLATARWLARGGTAAWRGARAGARVLGVAVVALGVVAVVAFDTLFSVFHVLFFAEGSYTFDPSTERMVQLFPYQFWFETAFAIGALIVGLAGATWALASWRIRRIEGAASATAEASALESAASGPGASGPAPT